MLVSFCAYIGVILGLWGCTIILYWFHTIQLVYHYTIMVIMIATSADDDRGIPMTTLLRLEGGRCECSEWPLVQSQGAGLMAPPLSMLGHTVVSSRSDWDLYISSVFLWWNSLGTSLVTRSLLFAPPVRCGIVLRLSRVSADFLLWAVDSVSWTTLGDRLLLCMVTENGRPEANRPGGDLPVRVHVPLSSRGGGGGGECDPWLSRTWTRGIFQMFSACVPRSRKRR